MLRKVKNKEHPCQVFRTGNFLLYFPSLAAFTPPSQPVCSLPTHSSFSGVEVDRDSGIPRASSNLLQSFVCVRADFSRERIHSSHLYFKGDYESVEQEFCGSLLGELLIVKDIT